MIISIISQSCELLGEEAESMKTHQPHVAIFPSPGMGHITPLLELAKRLVTRDGFHVSFFVIPTEASAAQNHLLRSPTLPSGLQVINLPPVNVSADTVDLDIITTTRIIIQESLTSLRSVVVDLHQLNAIIVDVFFIDAIDIANDLSVPTYVFFTASATLLALSFYFPTFDREVNGVFSDLRGSFQLPGCKPMPVEDLTDSVLDRNVLPIISRLPEVAGILVNTWEELEPITLRALSENPFFLQIPTPPVYHVGPIIKVNEPVMTTTDAECLAWLDKQPINSVVYISFGSGGTLSIGQVIELAWGLELSRQRFIWVARKPTESNASGTNYFGGSGEVNEPAEYLPEGFLERTKGVGLVVPSWGPQVAVLGHPSTAGFLSHCGWNSVLESIVHGVPMIAWPLYADQGMNAWMLAEEVGVAVRPVVEMGKKVLGRDEISKVVRLLVEGEEGKLMKCRARELQESARKALDCGGSSYDLLSYVAKSWTTEFKT